MARIERATRRRAEADRDPGPVRRTAVAGVVAGATLAGLREAFDPPERAVVTHVDPWAGGGTHPRVRFHWHPVPQHSVAEVLW